MRKRKSDKEIMFDACALHVMLVEDRPMHVREIATLVRKLTTEERLDALARYQENDPTLGLDKLT